MDVATIVEAAIRLGVIPSLFVYLLFDTRKEHAEQIKEAHDRERQLMESLAKSDGVLENFAASLNKIGETLNGMDRSLSFLQKDVENLKNA